MSETMHCKLCFLYSLRNANEHVPSVFHKIGRCQLGQYPDIQASTRSSSVKLRAGTPGANTLGGAQTLGASLTLGALTLGGAGTLGGALTLGAGTLGALTLGALTLGAGTLLGATPLGAEETLGTSTLGRKPSFMRLTARTAVSSSPLDDEKL